MQICSLRVFINFRGRNLAKDKQLFSHIVKEFLEIDSYNNGTEASGCKNCTLFNECPFRYNILNLMKESSINGLRILFDTLYLKGIHVTVRDLLSVLSYFITKGYDCNELVDSGVNLETIYYFNNVFSYSGKSNDILLELSQLDISKKDFTKIDNDLFKEIKSTKNFDTTKSILSKMKAVKRQKFFEVPLIFGENLSLYELLPLEYLSEYKIIVDKVKSSTYLDSMDDKLPLLRDFELGLNRISNPNHSEAQLVLFDSPPITSKDVRLEYSSEEQLRLIFCTPQFYSSDGKGGEVSSIDDLNSFFCFVFNDMGCEIKDCPVIKVDYKLFELIMLAKDNIFTGKNAKLADNVHIQSFTKKIFDSIKKNNGVTVTWTSNMSGDLVDFNIAYIKPSGFGRKMEKDNRILISHKRR